MQAWLIKFPVMHMNTNARYDRIRIIGNCPENEIGVNYNSLGAFVN